MEYFQKQAGEHWQKIMELTFILGYFKGELRSQGYTSEHLDKLEKDAIKAYNETWKG
jgi:hypothetical protein